MSCADAWAGRPSFRAYADKAAGTRTPFVLRLGNALASALQELASLDIWLLRQLEWASSLPEGAFEIVCEWLCEVAQGRTFAGLDEHFDRHPW